MGVKETIVHVEKFRDPLNRPPKTLKSRLFPRYKCDPVTDYCIHHHFKYGGGGWAPMGGILVSFEWGAVISSRLVHHEEVIPIVT